MNKEILRQAQDLRGSAKIVVILLALAVVLGVGYGVWVGRVRVSDRPDDIGAEDDAAVSSVVSPHKDEVWRVGETREIQWNVPDELKDGSRVYVVIDVFPEALLSEIGGDLDNGRAIIVAMGDDKTSHASYGYDFLRGTHSWKIPFHEFARKASFLNIPLVVRVRMWKGDLVNPLSPSLSVVSRPFSVIASDFSQDDLKRWIVYRDDASGTTFEYPHTYVVQKSRGRIHIINSKFEEILGAFITPFVPIGDYIFKNPIVSATNYYDSALGYWVHKAYDGSVSRVMPWGVTKNGDEIYRFGVRDAGEGYQEYVVWLRGRSGVATLRESLSEIGVLPKGYTADDGYAFSMALGLVARSIR